MAKQLSFKKAKRLAIIKWQSHIDAGGFNIDINNIVELKNLENKKRPCNWSLHGR